MAIDADFSYRREETPRVSRQGRELQRRDPACCEGERALLAAIALAASKALMKAIALPLSVIQRFNVLCDRSQIRIGRDNLEVAARNALAPQFAHFDDSLATHKAAELGKKAPLTTGEQSLKAFPDCHILSSKPARHIRARRHKKRRGPSAE
jgi:hypothetical protein